MKISVIDALCGAGKTTWAAKRCAEVHNSGKRFVYITPELDLVQDVLDRLAALGVVALQPVDDAGRKLDSFHTLLQGGHNVVSTHALFELVDERTKKALLDAGYVLVIDEVTDWLEEIRCNEAEQEMLMGAGYLKLEDDRRMSWEDKSDKTLPTYKRIRSLARQGKLMKPLYAEDLLVWEFPVEFLGLFEEVYILTHLFDGSDMAAFLALYSLPVEKYTMSLDKGSLVPYHSTAGRAAERARIDAIRPLITVVDDPKLNAVGEPVATRSGKAQQPLWRVGSTVRPIVRWSIPCGRTSTTSSGTS